MMDVVATGERIGAILHGNQVDANEVKKLIAFLRRRKGDAGGRDLRELLTRLIGSRQAFAYSQQTVAYHQAILQVLNSDLASVNDSLELQHIFGWAARLMRYYKAEGAMPVMAAHMGGAPQGNAPRRDGPRMQGPRGPGGPRQQAPMIPRTPMPAMPVTVKFKNDEDVMVTLEQVDTSACVGKARGQEIRFDSPAIGLKVGERAIVRIQAENGGHYLAIFKKKL